MSAERIQSKAAAAPRPSVLPPSLAPRGLSRVQAAEYVGFSPSTFDAMVDEGTMPKPKRRGRRVVWDRLRLDEAFAALPSDDDAQVANPWDEDAHPQHQTERRD